MSIDAGRIDGDTYTFMITENVAQVSFRGSTAGLLGSWKLWGTQATVQGAQVSQKNNNKKRVNVKPEIVSILESSRVILSRQAAARF